MGLQALMTETVYGIVAGVATSLLFGVTGWIYLRFVRPWIEAKIYRGLDLSGEWSTAYSIHDEDRTEQVTLRQCGHRVRGTALYDHGDERRRYEIEGDFENNVFTARYKLTGRSSLDRGAYVLTVRNDGAELDGVVSWYNPAGQRIEMTPYHWTKRIG